MLGYTDRVPELRPGTVFTSLRGTKKSILVDILDGSTYALNSTGYYIVSHLGRKLTVGELASSLANEFDVDNQTALKDTRVFLSFLEEKKLLLWEPLQKYIDKYWQQMWEHNTKTVGFKYHLGLIYWEFTNHCNLRCFMCYNESGPARSYELSLEEKLELIDRFKEMGVTVLILTGGEPCTKPKHLIEVLKKCRQVGINTQLFTNATLITNKLLDAFTDYGVSHIRASLHGATAETHDAVTQQIGSFDKAIAAIQRLKDRGLKVTWQVTASKKNLHELRQAVEYAVRLGLDGFRVGSLDLIGSGKEQDEYVLSPEEEVRLWRFIDETTLFYADKIRTGWGADQCLEDAWVPYVQAPVHRSLVEPADSNYFSRFCKTSLCGTGIRSLAVKANGMATPCPAMSDYEIGNALTGLCNVWESSNLLNKLRRADLQGFNDCQVCGFRYLCGAGCRAMAYHLSGSITGRDPRRCQAMPFLLDFPTSGFYEESALKEAIERIAMSDQEHYKKWFNDVMTEGLGPWVPYWSIIAGKWKQRSGA